MEIRLVVGPTSEKWFDMVQLVSLVEQAFARCAAPFLPCCHTLLHKGCDVATPMWKSLMPRFLGSVWRQVIWLEEMMAMLQHAKRRMRAPMANE